MLGEIFYFSFSLILFLGAALYLANLLLLKWNGRTIYGAYKSGTPERERVVGLASNRNIFITLVVACILTANLFYCVYRVINLDSQQHLLGPLLFITILVFLIFALTVPAAREKIRAIEEISEARKKK